MATPSSVRAWRIPWTEEPGEPQSMGLQSWTWQSNWHRSCWWRGVRGPASRCLCLLHCEDWLFCLLHVSKVSSGSTISILGIVLSEVRTNDVGRGENREHRVQWFSRMKGVYVKMWIGRGQMPRKLWWQIKLLICQLRYCMHNEFFLDSPSFLGHFLHLHSHRP